MLEELDHKNIFQAVEWLSNIRQYTTSPIQRQVRTLAVDNLANQKVLRKALIIPSPLNSDYPAIQLDLGQKAETDPISWHLFVKQEIEAGIFYIGNTAERVDKTLLLLLKKLVQYTKRKLCSCSNSVFMRDTIIRYLKLRFYLSYQSLANKLDHFSVFTVL